MILIFVFNFMGIVVFALTDVYTLLVEESDKHVHEEKSQTLYGLIMFATHGCVLTYLQYSDRGGLKGLADKVHQKWDNLRGREQSDLIWKPDEIEMQNVNANLQTSKGRHDARNLTMI